MAPNRGAQLLAEALSQRGWSQYELAARIEQAQPTVSHWSTGRRKPDRASAGRLLALLGIPSESWDEPALPETAPPPEAA